LLGNMESSKQLGADNYHRSPIYILIMCILHDYVQLQWTCIQWKR